MAERIGRFTMAHGEGTHSIVPEKLRPIVKLAVAICGVMVTFNFFPNTNLDEKICGGVVSVAAALGLARKEDA